MASSPAAAASARRKQKPRKRRPRGRRFFLGENTLPAQRPPLAGADQKYKLTIINMQTPKTASEAKWLPGALALATVGAATHANAATVQITFTGSYISTTAGNHLVTDFGGDGVADLRGHNHSSYVAVFRAVTSGMSGFFGLAGAGRTSGIFALIGTERLNQYPQAELTGFMGSVYGVSPHGLTFLSSSSPRRQDHGRFYRAPTVGSRSPGDPSPASRRSIRSRPRCEHAAMSPA